MTRKEFRFWGVYNISCSLKGGKRHLFSKSPKSQSASVLYIDIATRKEARIFFVNIPLYRLESVKRVLWIIFTTCPWRHFFFDMSRCLECVVALWHLFSPRISTVLGWQQNIHVFLKTYISLCLAPPPPVCVELAPPPPPPPLEA